MFKPPLISPNLFYFHIKQPQPRVLDNSFSLSDLSELSFEFSKFGLPVLNTDWQWDRTPRKLPPRCRRAHSFLNPFLEFCLLTPAFFLAWCLRPRMLGAGAMEIRERREVGSGREGGGCDEDTESGGEDAWALPLPPGYPPAGAYGDGRSEPARRRYRRWKQARRQQR